MNRLQRALACVVTVAYAALSSSPLAAEERSVVVGSKNFNESYILAEISAQLLEANGFAVDRKFGLGGTLICFEALVNGDIDLYVEYTGTLSQAILSAPLDASFDDLNAMIEPRGLILLAPLGFNNTYAIATKEETARRLGLTSIADLAEHPDLNVMVSHEFLEREDGWPGLARTYGLTSSVGGIEHGLAYQALDDGAIDVTDAYSTDGEFKRYGLSILADDRGYFPQYLAAPLARRDIPAAARQALATLGGTLSDAEMQQLNADVVFAKRTFEDVAQEFLNSRGLLTTTDVRSAGQQRLWDNLIVNTLQHLKLTFIALVSAVTVGVLLSLVVFRNTVMARAVVYVAGLLQTIPSIALLALMIPLFGIGALPAIIALFLYSLLPILRNTITALTTLDPLLIRVAVAMGLSNTEQLRHVYVPLAMPSMLAGIRTAAVISIGTATLAAFIGAGGLGDPIVTGLALNDTGLILQGAVPAAVLAILTELGFEVVERWLVPGHLRVTQRQAPR